MTSQNMEIELLRPTEPPQLREPEEKSKEQTQSQNPQEEPKECPRSQPSHAGKSSPWIKVKTFWTTNIAVAVKPESARDHLALERTFLGWIRTSITLVMSGSILAQLFVLVENNLVETGKLLGDSARNQEESLNLTNGAIKFSGVGRPLAASLVVLALITSLTAIFRFYRWQSALLNGKAISGGIEIWGIGGIVLLVVSIHYAFVIVASMLVSGLCANDPSADISASVGRCLFAIVNIGILDRTNVKTKDNA